MQYNSSSLIKTMTEFLQHRPKSQEISGSLMQWGSLLEPATKNSPYSSLLFLVASHHYIITRRFNFSTHTDYAVQPQAVNFTTIPKSQTVIQGGTVTLNCSCPIVKLGSNYPVPHLEWWKNGTRIREPEKPTKDDIRRGYLVSELVIEDASEGDEGYYECIAVDGKRKGEKKGPGNHVVSSPRAYVQVVCKFTAMYQNSLMPENVSVNLAETHIENIFYMLHVEKNCT